MISEKKLRKLIQDRLKLTLKVMSAPLSCGDWSINTSKYSNRDSKVSLQIFSKTAGSMPSEEIVLCEPLIQSWIIVLLQERTPLWRSAIKHGVCFKELLICLRTRYRLVRIMDLYISITLYSRKQRTADRRAILNDTSFWSFSCQFKVWQWHKTGMFV